MSDVEELTFNLWFLLSEEDLADLEDFELELVDNEAKSLKFGMSLMEEGKKLLLPRLFKGGH